MSGFTLSQWFDDIDEPAVSRLFDALKYSTEATQLGVVSYKFAEAYYEAQVWMLEHEASCGHQYPAFASGFSYAIGENGRRIQELVLDDLPQFKPPVPLRELMLIHQRLWQEHRRTHTQEVVSFLGILLHPDSAIGLWPPFKGAVNQVERLCNLSQFVG